eukprot:scaffold4598_cov73-Cyclotella_meneghiniana.AAC.6
MHLALTHQDVLGGWEIFREGMPTFRDNLQYSLMRLHLFFLMRLSRLWAVLKGRAAVAGLTFAKMKMAREHVLALSLIPRLTCRNTVPRSAR